MDMQSRRNTKNKQKKKELRGRVSNSLDNPQFLLEKELSFLHLLKSLNLYKVAKQVYLLNLRPTVEATVWLSGKHYGLQTTGSRVGVPLEARLFPNLNGVALHRAFHVHPSKSWYEWNTVEREVKPQLIHPSTEPYSTDDLSVYSVDKYSRARWHCQRDLGRATLSHCHGNDNGLTMPKNIWSSTLPHC